MSRPANRKQRKRPQAKCRNCAMLGKRYIQLQHKWANRGSEIDDLRREQEKLRAQLDAAHQWQISDCACTMLNVLSHALDRANLVIHRLPGFREYKFAMDRSFECAELKARVARLTAEKETLDADCAKIRGERDKLLRKVQFIPGDLGTSWACGHGKWNARGDCVTCLSHCVDYLNKEVSRLRIEATQKEMEPGQETTSANGACKPKPWYRRSFTELFRRGGA